MTKIYLINIKDVNDYMSAHNLLAATIDFVLDMTEEQCIEMVRNSKDPHSGVYSPLGFEAEFDNDIYSIINTDNYFIRIF